MDQKVIGQIDPKLQEAYTRIMGTPIPQPHATSSTNAVPKPFAHIDPGGNPRGPGVPTILNEREVIREHPKVVYYLLFLGGVVFFLVYTLFWFNFFGIKLPALPL